MTQPRLENHHKQSDLSLNLNNKEVNNLINAFREKIYHSKPVTDEIFHNLSPKAIDQTSYYGDCFFLSSLASLANSQEGRQIIKNMISQNSDGSYTVTFPGDTQKPINVTKADLTNYAPNNQALWANIIETAFLKYDDVHSTKDKKGDIGNFAKNTHNFQAIHLLTNEDVATSQFGVVDLGSGELTFGGLAKETVRSEIIKALAQNKVITAGAGPRFQKYLGGHIDGPIVSDHVYSIIAFDPKTDMITIRNPWGENNYNHLGGIGTTVDGITNIGGGELKMSLAVFYNDFSDINYAGSNPYSHALHSFVAQSLRAIDSSGQALSTVFESPTKNHTKIVGKAINDDLYTVSNLLNSTTQVISYTGYLAIDKGVSIVEELDKSLKSIW